MILGARFASCQIVFRATNIRFDSSIVAGSPVFGFGSK